MELHFTKREEWRKWLEGNHSTRRLYLQWLNSAKRPETFSRRVCKIVELADKNIKTSMF